LTAVVVAKVPSGNRAMYIASSVILVSKKKGNEFVDGFLTHDVLADEDLPSLAGSIAYQCAVMRFRAAADLWN
jgi:hypothetical protein